MKKTEHVSYKGLKMPSRRTRLRLKEARENFERAYLNWLRSPKWFLNRAEAIPVAAHFGLTKSQVATIIQHCRKVVRSEKKL